MLRSPFLAAITVTCLVASGCGGGSDGGTAAAGPASATAMDARCTSVIGQRSAGGLADLADSWETRHGDATATALAASWFTDQKPAPAAALAPLVERMRAVGAAARLELAQVAARDETAYRKAADEELAAWSEFMVTADQAAITHCANILLLATNPAITPDDADLAIDGSLTYATWWCVARAGHLPAAERAFVADRITTSLNDATVRGADTFSITYAGATLTVKEVGAKIADALAACPRLPASDPDGAALQAVLAAAGDAGAPA